MLSVARLVSFWRCIPMQYNCQKSSNFQGLSHFSRIFGKNDKIPGFFQAGKTVTIFPGFPGAVGTLNLLPGFIILAHGEQMVMVYSQEFSKQFMPQK